MYIWKYSYISFLWLQKQSAGFVQCIWIDVYCCNIPRHKLLFNNSTICGNRALCLVPRKICWNVFFHGLFICTGLKSLQSNSSAILLYYIGKAAMLWTQWYSFVVVGGHRNTIYLIAGNFICGYHISNDRFPLVSSKNLLVLLHHILYIFILCIPWNADNVIEHKSGYSFRIVNCSLHHIQSLFWIPHARTGKSFRFPKISFSLVSLYSTLRACLNLWLNYIWI